MNKKITVNLAVAIAILAMTVTFVVTMILSMQLFNQRVNGVREKEIMYNKLAEIDKSVRANYYGEIVDETLYDYIAAGYVTGLGDRDAKYYTARQYLDYLDQQNGKVLGVGADVVKDATGYARIIRVYENSPAQESGLEKGFFITKIGDTDVKTLTLSQIGSQLQGEAGTSVTLTVVNATGEAEFAVELQRREYEVPSADAFLLGESTAYFRINTFNARTADELRTRFTRWEEEGVAVDGVIFDVRNNASDALTSAMQVIDYLCPAGTIASQQGKGGEVTTLETSDASEVDLPMVVLVNGDTAGAAELFAASVREFDKGRIVGVRTAGKGAIQCKPVPLTDGSAVSYRVGMLLTKDGASFNGTGIVPDVEIALTAEQEAAFYDLTFDTDTQLSRAQEVLNTMLGKNSVQGTVTPSNSDAGSSSVSEAAGSGTSASEPASEP